MLWERPGRRYQFSTMWRDREAVRRWVDNEFHRKTLMPAFRRWCTEGWFGDFAIDAEQPRARRCPSCARWSRGEPGWNESEPATCGKCGAALAID